ncbi:MAG: SGNH/GDSL hydrolase family protein [Verrucomicrobia bacterium]|nr:SGNH/GDSL hydrolase family protein [Verrucomicrobiota bacterium]
MKTILCFGDSNTWGFDPASITSAHPCRHPLDVRWTGRLATELGADFRVIEEGQNGRTTVHDDPLNVCRNGRDYLPACLESHKPIDIAVLMLGTNDLKSFYNLPPGEIANGAAILAKMILASDAGPRNQAPQLLLVCPPQIGDLSHLPDLEAKIPNGILRSQQFPRYYQAIAAALGCAYLNSQEIVQTSPVDGIHLDASEHTKLGSAIAVKIRQMVG